MRNPHIKPAKKKKEYLLDFEIPIGARVFNFETQPNEDESFIYAIAPADGYFVINQFRHVPICRGQRIVVAKSAEIYFDRAALA